MDSAVQSYGQFLKFDPTGLETLRFYAAGDRTLLVTYAKDEYVYLSISFDCGARFVNTEKIMKIKGEIKDIQILAKDNQFVVAIKETVSTKDYKRAIAGWMFPKENTFRFKECTESEVEGKIINISLGFREYEPGKYESVDYVFYLDEDWKVHMASKGHPCIIK